MTNTFTIDGTLVSKELKTSKSNKSYGVVLLSRSGMFAGKPKTSEYQCLFFGSSIEQLSAIKEGAKVIVTGSLLGKRSDLVTKAGQPFTKFETTLAANTITATHQPPEFTQDDIPF